ncbi:hypothetical protein JCM33374_g5000 [Metschnikowia sp. JCM 33374]|nr:hypothetical protein JCM33374_g5000 [Metschnikowia sp. JCM 33374]
MKIIMLSEGLTPTEKNDQERKRDAKKKAKNRNKKRNKKLRRLKNAHLHESLRGIFQDKQVSIQTPNHSIVIHPGMSIEDAIKTCPMLNYLFLSEAVHPQLGWLACFLQRYGHITSDQFQLLIKHPKLSKQLDWFKTVRNYFMSIPAHCRDRSAGQLKYFTNQEIHRIMWIKKAACFGVILLRVTLNEVDATSKFPGQLLSEIIVTHLHNMRLLIIENFSKPDILKKLENIYRGSKARPQKVYSQPDLVFLQRLACERMLIWLIPKCQVKFNENSQLFEMRYQDFVPGMLEDFSVHPILNQFSYKSNMALREVLNGFRMKCDTVPIVLNVLETGHTWRCFKVYLKNERSVNLSAVMTCHLPKGSDYVFLEKPVLSDPKNPDWYQVFGMVKLEENQIPKRSFNAFDLNYSRFELSEYISLDNE